MRETVPCFDLNRLLQLSPFAEVSLYEVTSDSLFAEPDRRIDAITSLRGRDFFGKGVKAGLRSIKGFI